MTTNSPSQGKETFLLFEEVSNHGKQTKTKWWTVFPRIGRATAAPLGEIKWFSRWRKYCFFTYGDVILDHHCMTELAAFCQTHHKDRNENNS